MLDTDFTEDDVNKVLTKIAKLCKQGRALTTTPIKPHIQVEIDAGNVKAIPMRAGPLGIYTGEVELILTDKGCEHLKG